MDNNTIPPMIHPLSTAWQQPPVSDILIDDTHALMDEAAFNRLHEYSHSMPSSVYDGKMWKGYFSSEDVWLLKWFGPSVYPDCCKTSVREIIIVK